MNTKITLIIFVISCSCFAPVLAVRFFNLWFQVKAGILNRMNHAMRTIYVKLDERTTDLHSIRFRFENSKEFEEGYLMSVIIEKYRQAVEHTKISTKIRSFQTFDVIMRLDLVQRAYIDVFRMVNMMHEIPRKYGFDIRKRKLSTLKSTNEELIKAIESFKYKETNRKKKRRLQLKELKRLREVMQAAGENLTMTPRSTRNTKKWWDFQEYGWELAEDYRDEW